MKKINILWLIIDIIFLVTFNVVFFICCGLNNAPSVWLSYGFMHFAFVMVLITPMFSKTKDEIMGKYTLYSLSVAYFFAEYIAGIVFIILKLPSIKIPLVVQLIMASIFGVVLVLNLIANEKTNMSLKRECQNDFVSYCTKKLKVIERRNKSLPDNFEKLLDLISTSPQDCDLSVKNLENDIRLSIDDLMDNIAYMNENQITDIIDETICMVNERNIY